MPRLRKGVTLVEVVASLLLLSTLLVVVLAAFSDHVRQIRRAHRRLAAVAAADRLLVDWFSTPGQFPRNTTNAVSGDDQLAWRTRLLDYADPENLGIEIARLEIVDQKSADSPVLLAVDVVLPAPASPTESEAADAPQTEPAADGGHAP